MILGQRERLAREAGDDPAQPASALAPGEALTLHGGLERSERFLLKPFRKAALVAATREALADPAGQPRPAR